MARKLSVAIAEAAKSPKYVDLLENKFVIPAIFQEGKELEAKMRDFDQRMIRLVQFLKK